MSKRCGKPGMPPSPNQQIVLDELKQMAITDIQGGRFSGQSIDAVTSHLEDVHKVKGIGGTDVGPWHRSTVRDHLNDLVLKAHVIKTFAAGRSYYRPVQI